VANNRWVFACFVCALVCFVAIVGLRRAAFRIGLVDSPGGRKRHGDVVPLLGGVSIILSLVVSMLIVPPAVWPPGFVRPLLAATGLIAIAGVLDDLHEISARLKLVFQFSSIAMLTSFAGVSLDDLGAVGLESNLLTGAWAVPFTFVAAIGLMNAVNMVDGVDGLLAGACLITFGFLAYIAKRIPGGLPYYYVISFICVSLSVFLVFNFPRRGRLHRTFLGDTGSLFLGLMVCWFSVTLSQKPVQAAPPIVFVWLCGVFLLDFLCTTIYRLLRRRNPLTPDRRHLHHLLLRAGLSPRQVCVLLLLVHAAVAILGIVMWQTGVSEQTMLFGAILILILFVFLSLCARLWVPYLARQISSTRLVKLGHRT
jgi:UDP-GlcNAc:undecaprenyl-phosphate/decaprenyl-phosphate GlcNAc-1-phosphate transferase